MCFCCCSPIQYFTSGGGSKAWRGVQNTNEDDLKFFYDGQGFMSLQLDHSEAHFTFYDVDGKELSTRNEAGTRIISSWRTEIDYVQCKARINVTL